MNYEDWSNMGKSVWRNAHKILILFLIGYAQYAATYAYPLFFGDLFAPLLRGFGLCFMGLGIGLLGQTLIETNRSSKELVEDAINNKNIASAVVYVGRRVLLVIIMMLFVTASRADAPPTAAAAKLPILKQELSAYWPELKQRSFVGAQVEQETCISLTHSKCWNELAELKTPREHGVGLGQLTVAYDAQGKVRFDTMATLKAKHPKELAALSWQNWKDARLQLRALALMQRDQCAVIKDYASERDHLDFCMAAYNGGLGGLNSDRLSCRATKGCDASKWFGNVENTSLKSKTIIPGYGRSAFQINREYVKNIDVVRQPRYLILNT